MKLTEMTAFYGFGVLTASLSSLTCSKLLSIIIMGIGASLMLLGVILHKFEKWNLEKYIGDEKTRKL